jgi:hypothetical protein
MEKSASIYKGNGRGTAGRLAATFFQVAPNDTFSSATRFLQMRHQKIFPFSRPGVPLPFPL